jgi:4-methyl-5(b-hydroxyethyl)-thiazole monophosphate biosynthesis
MVYLFLADGFEEIEALTPVDLLRRAGVAVTTVGVTGKTVTGSHGITVAADVSAEEAIAAMHNGEAIDIEMIILPGGMPGAATLDASEVVDTFIDAAEKANAYIAAICAAPMILGKRGLLNGKKATCFPGFESELNGAIIESAAVVTDGNITTGNGMESALLFGKELVKNFTN